MKQVPGSRNAAHRGLIVDRWRRHRIAFVGREVAPAQIGPRQVLRSLSSVGLSAPRGVAWNRQIHSSRVRSVSSSDAEEKRCRAEVPAEADALYNLGDQIVLAVFTADCVPVLIAGERESAAVHAGWRGLEAEILARALERFVEPRNTLVAWIGPAMGHCCYEVDWDVAHRVGRSGGPGTIYPGRNHRPHLDLAGAAYAQLTEAGLRDVRLVARCTGCDDGWWSYRRGAVRGERNLAFIWQAPSD